MRFETSRMHVAGFEELATLSGAFFSIQLKAQSSLSRLFVLILKGICVGFSDLLLSSTFSTLSHTYSGGSMKLRYSNLPLCLLLCFSSPFSSSECPHACMSVRIFCGRENSVQMEVEFVFQELSDV